MSAVYAPQPVHSTLAAPPRVSGRSVGAWWSHCPYTADGAAPRWDHRGWTVDGARCGGGRRAVWTGEGTARREVRITDARHLPQRRHTRRAATLSPATSCEDLGKPSVARPLFRHQTGLSNGDSSKESQKREDSGEHSGKCSSQSTNVRSRQKLSTLKLRCSLGVSSRIPSDGPISLHPARIPCCSVDSVSSIASAPVRPCADWPLSTAALPSVERRRPSNSVRRLHSPRLVYTGAAAARSSPVSDPIKPQRCPLQFTHGAGQVSGSWRSVGIHHPPPAAHHRY